LWCDDRDEYYLWGVHYSVFVVLGIIVIGGGRMRGAETPPTQFGVRDHGLVDFAGCDADLGCHGFAAKVSRRKQKTTEGKPDVRGSEEAGRKYARGPRSIGPLLPQPQPAGGYVALWRGPTDAFHAGSRCAGRRTDRDPGRELRKRTDAGYLAVKPDFVERKPTPGIR